MHKLMKWSGGGLEGGVFAILSLSFWKMISYR